MSPSEQAIVDTMEVVLKDVCGGELYKKEVMLFENKVLSPVLRVTLYYRYALGPPLLTKIEEVTGSSLEMYRLIDKDDPAFMITLEYKLSEKELEAIKETTMYKDLRWCLLDPFDNVKSEIAELEGSLEKGEKIAMSNSEVVRQIKSIERCARELRDTIDHFTAVLNNP